MIEDIRYPKKINWIIFLFFIVLMFVLLFYFDRAVAEERDPQATAIAEKTINAMGGLDQWKSVPAIRFNFVVEQEGKPPRAIKHLWDRKNGRDHIDGTKDGKPIVAWINLKTKSGTAWLEGKKLEGEELSKAMEWAYGRWVNDTYWFTMPWKLLDSGVNLKFEGEKNEHDVLHLSFNNVGLTPGDHYWAFISKKTGLMDQWEFLLQGEKEKEAFHWKEWNDYGKIKLSKLKESPDGKFKIRFEPLEVMDEADPSLFGAELKTLN